MKLLVGLFSTIMKLHNRIRPAAILLQVFVVKSRSQASIIYGNPGDILESGQPEGTEIDDDPRNSCSTENHHRLSRFFKCEA